MNATERDFYTGLGIGIQWADTVDDAATRERFVDAAVFHGLQTPQPESAGDVAMRLAASILGVRCDDDAAEAFWLMTAPGVDVAGTSHWFFEGFVAGAADVFREGHKEEFGELRKLVRDPTRPA
jgi:hypothetical protein